MPSADEHMQQIQSRVDVERARLSVLDGQVKDPSLRHDLQEAVQWLDVWRISFSTVLAKKKAGRTP